MLGYGNGIMGGIWTTGIDWRIVYCYLVPGGLSIDKTGDFISFDKILNYHRGKRKGLITKHTNITLELVGEKTFNLDYRTLKWHF